MCRVEQSGADDSFSEWLDPFLLISTKIGQKHLMTTAETTRTDGQHHLYAESLWTRAALGIEGDKATVAMDKYSS